PAGREPDGERPRYTQNNEERGEIDRQDDGWIGTFQRHADYRNRRLGDDAQSYVNEQKDHCRFPQNPSLAGLLCSVRTRPAVTGFWRPSLPVILPEKVAALVTAGQKRTQEQQGCNAMPEGHKLSFQANLPYSLALRQ